MQAQDLKKLNEENVLLKTELLKTKSELNLKVSECKQLKVQLKDS